jgi:prepilin-type N-terminal cleavage/methylation domain
MQRRNYRGFTLLELIVVLLIIGFMSALVVPKLVGPMSNLNLKTASKKIAASLRYARSQAASEKTTYVALFDFDKDRLSIIIPPLLNGDFEAPDEAPEEQPDGGKGGPGGLKVYDLPDGVGLEKGVSEEGEVDSGLFRIFFFPNGGSGGGEIIVANKRGGRYKVSVDFIIGTVQLSEVMD